MALARKGRSQRTIDYWPGFVDALSTLLLSIMFLLTVFVLGQFLLSREISGKDEVLTRLNSQINELTQLLALEKSGKQDLGFARQSPGIAFPVGRRTFTAPGAARPGRRQQRRGQPEDRTARHRARERA